MTIVVLKIALAYILISLIFYISLLVGSFMVCLINLQSFNTTNNRLVLLTEKSDSSENSQSVPPDQHCPLNFNVGIFVPWTGEGGLLSWSFGSRDFCWDRLACFKFEKLNDLNIFFVLLFHFRPSLSLSVDRERCHCGNTARARTEVRNGDGSECK